MKTKWYFPALILLLLSFQIDVLAQDEPALQIVFKLTDNTNKTSHTYKVNSVNYSISNPYYMQDESKLINNGSCSVSMEMAQDADEFLLKWIAGSVKNVSGIITTTMLNSVKKPRTLAISEMQVLGSSESFYTSAGANTFPLITISAGTLSVDGITIFSQLKTHPSVH